MAEVLIRRNLTLDRSQDTSAPRHPDVIYPPDYGHLENTVAGDGGGIDVWLGTLNTVNGKDDAKMLTGILCTFDTLTKCRTDDRIGAHHAIILRNLEFDEAGGKRDAEPKLSIGCKRSRHSDHPGWSQRYPMLYLPNPTVENDLSS